MTALPTTALRRAAAPLELPILRRTAAIAAAVLGATALVAVTIRAAGAGAARDQLDLAFGGLPRTAGAAWTVFAANLRLLGVTFVAALVAHLTCPRDGAGRAERFFGRVPVVICDVVLALGCLLHVALVGAALGGYGLRAAGYVLPHGPVELTGFALGLALYLEARAGRLVPRAAVAPAVLAVVVLAVAAGLEVFTGA
ncbi:hypothetical protein DSM104299_00528 [Baekduia alba]|uniref:hypothetical protein n=1 Tax=Baekduia alba TaxID=2997333 RepID=UPI002340C39D|nr:hypothetical protein [Baekduia alba]WCB91850.1 hypothetical protein DSM104299_00528 [Baekduia alba]